LARNDDEKEVDMDGADDEFGMGTGG